MQHEIIRHRVPVHNNTLGDILAERTFNVGKTLFQEPTGFTVSVESATVDLSQAVLDPNPGYGVAVYCNLKEGEGKPDGMDFGLNFYTFDQPLVTVPQFLRFLDDILLKKALPFNLGIFEMTKDEGFKYTIQPGDKTNSFDSGNFEVYFNPKLHLLLRDFCEETPSVLMGVTWYQLRPETKVAEAERVYRLNKIESILFMTDLPVTQTRVLDSRINEMVPYQLLGSVEVNNLAYSIATKSDWRYIPTLLRPYTMNQLSPVEAYSVRALLQYTGGEIRMLTLAPEERFILNLVFTPLGVLH